MWTTVASTLVIAALLVLIPSLLHWAWLGWTDARRVRMPVGRTPLEIELETLRSAARIRDVTIAAEQYMEAFVEDRQPADVPDVEVLDDQERRWHRDV